MPRYLYECTECNETETVFHGMNEEHTECSSCGKLDCMQKLLTNSFAIKKPTTSENAQDTGEVGELTKQYIEENRALLKEEQKRATEDLYDPS